MPQFPTVHPRANLVILLRGRRTEIGPHSFTVQLLDPGGNSVLQHGGTMHINEPPAGVMELESPAVMVLDLPLSGPGEYAFMVELDNMLMARVAFQVSHAGGPVVGQGGGMH